MHSGGRVAVEARGAERREEVVGDDGVIELQHLPAEIRYASPGRANTTAGCPFVLPEQGVDLEEVDRGLLLQALDRTGGNQSAAARLLGISRYALRYRMEKYGLLQKGSGNEARP